MRGLVRERGHWGSYLEQLQAELPEHKIIAPNIPGTGDLYKLPSETSIEATFEYVRKSIKEQIPEDTKVDLVAISLGGMVATAWIQKYPEDFNRIVLMNTSYRGLTPFYKRMAASTFLKLLKTRFVKSNQEREEMIYSIVSNSEPDEALISHWVELANKHPVSTPNAIKQLSAASVYKPDLNKKPDLPILLLAGEKDKLCWVGCSHAISKHWGFPLKIHPQAGHEIHHDATEWVFDHIKNWLNQ